MAFKLEEGMRPLMDLPSLLEWAGSAQAAIRDRIVSAELELEKLEVLTREMAERLRCGPPAPVITSQRAKTNLADPNFPWPKRYQPPRRP